MSAPTVILIRRPKTLPSGKRVKYYTLRWPSKSGGHCYESLGRTDKTSASDAKAALKQKRLDLGMGKSRQGKATKMKLSEYLKFHQEQFGQDKRPATLVEWQTAGDHAVKALGDKLIADIVWTDAGVIRAYLAKLGRSKATTRKTLTILKALLGRAAKKKIINENPLGDVELGKPIVGSKRIYTEAEIGAMVEVADLWWKAAITLAHTSGLRRGELLHLRQRDFDPQAGTVRVEEHHTDDDMVMAWQPKTEASTRTVPIPPQTVMVLLRLQRRLDGTPYLFLNVNQLRSIDARAKAGKARPDADLVASFNRRFTAIQDKAKAWLGTDNWPRGTWHDLRKTMTTRAAANGVPMTDLQHFLGHSSIKTTAEYYTEVEASAADRLRAVFSEVA